MKLLSLLKNKVVKNAGWIIGGRIVHMLCAFVVSLLTARYLGPGNYGLIHYATAYTTFFYSICTLGINSILVKCLIDEPEKEGETLGTALILQGAASLFSCLTILGIVKLVDGQETITVLVTALCTIGLMLRVFETVRYWFQAHLLSKFSAITSTVAYILTSAFRLVLLIREKSVTWFALATAVDYFAIAVLLFIFYKANKGPGWSFSGQQAKRLLRMGFPFILAGLMVSIYGNTDSFMLKHMVNEEEVGYYSTASSLCNTWVFVLSAIIESMYPSIMEAHKDNYAKYEQQNRLMYAIVFYVSIFVSVLFVLFARPAVRILYGEAYMPSVRPLQVITWYVAFSYLGVARNAWIVSENLQKFITPIYAGAAAMNVVVNFLLIPVWGATGAAVASLLTQISTIFVFPLFIKPMRKNTKLMAEAIILKGIR
ncbi:MAG: flippase [Clostridia bacterium]|nr:flippase [Clostridia bacterium]